METYDSDYVCLIVLIYADSWTPLPCRIIASAISTFLDSGSVVAKGRGKKTKTEIEKSNGIAIIFIKFSDNWPHIYQNIP